MEPYHESDLMSRLFVLRVTNPADGCGMLPACSYSVWLDFHALQRRKQLIIMSSNMKSKFYKNREIASLVLLFVKYFIFGFNTILLGSFRIRISR